MDYQLLIQWSAIFMTGVLAVSLLTGLTVQAIKSILKDFKKELPHNTLASVVAVVLSAALSVGYAIINEIPFSASYLVMSIFLAFVGFLMATNGYDKVKQALEQIIAFRKKGE